MKQAQSEWTRRTGKWIFLPMVLLAGCTFRSDEKYVDPSLTPPIAVVTSVDILSPTFEDPYFLASTTRFLIRVVEEGKFAERSVKEFKVTVDGTPIDFSVGDDAGIFAFELNPFTLGNGVFEVVVEARISTGSGSLAELSGLEYYQVTKSFKVSVDNSPIITQSLTASTIGGYLNLRWTASVDYPIQYLLSRTRYNGNLGIPLPDQQFSLADRSPNFVDSGYVGGKMEYRLYRKPQGASSPIHIGNVLVHKRAGGFIVSQSPQSVASMSWTPDFIDATLSLIRPSGIRQFPFVSGQATLDTIFLGDERTYRLQVQRSNYPGQYFDTTIQVIRPSNLPAFTKAVVAGSTTLILLRTNGALSRHTLPGFAEQQYHETLSPHIDLHVNSPGTTMVSFGRMFPNLQLLTSYQFFGIRFENPDGAYVQPLALAYSGLSDNLLLGLSIRVNGSPRAAVADLNLALLATPTPSILWMDSVNTDIPAISADGLYFCVNQMSQSQALVYKRVASTFQPQGSVPPYKRAFRGPGSAELVVMGPGSVEVFNANSAPGPGNSYSPVRSFVLPALSGETIVNVDYESSTQKLWIQSMDQWHYSTIRTYSITNFAATGKMKAYLPPSNPLVHHIYIRNHHFLTSGHGEPVQP